MELHELNKKVEEVREHIKNKSLDKALNMMNIIIKDKENAENKMVILEMGQIYLASENFSESKIWFNKVLDIDEDNIYAIRAMLRVSCNLEDYDEVCLYAKKIITYKEKFKNDVSDLINFLFRKLFKYKESDDQDNIKKIAKILEICKEYIEDCKLKNILTNELEILNKDFVLKSKPRVLIISMTSKCNIRCKMCKVPSNSWDFPNDKLHEIYHLFPTLQKVIWHGGEPFLYQGIDDLIAEAGKYNVNQVVSTNGLLLNEERINKVINNGMELNISIHGLTEQIYELIHCGGNFKQLINNLEIIKNIKKSSNVYMKYGLKFLVMKSNYRQLSDLYDFVIKYGFNHVHVNTLGHDSISEENFIYHNDDSDILKNVIKNSKILYEKFKKADISYEAWLPEFENVSGICEYQNRNEKKEQKFCCYMPWQSLQIDIGGFVRNNCNCENLIVGNINEEKIDDIWNNDKIVQIRKNIINNGFDEKCALDCQNGRISNLYLKNM